ncbi:MAG: hypothetical protein GDA43_14145, partial [Hormoscilla sp. SP5CHS1]|nr:hypothetical protein [Hormoscilla sp. SP5CHS1]
MISIFKPNTIVVIIDTGVENYQQLIDGVTTGKVNLPPALKTEVMATYSGVFNLEILLTIGSNGDNKGFGIATDSDGNVWATGYFNGSIDIDGDGNNDLTSNGGTDSYLFKFDPDGGLVKALNIGGSGNDQGYSITTDSDNNAWAIGYFNGSIDIDGDDNNDLTSNGGTDNYVAKFDPDGTLLFALNIGGSSNDEGTGIATDSDGNAWATGYFNSSSIDIDGDGNNDLTSNGLFDSYVAKFDRNGDLVKA